MVRVERETVHVTGDAGREVGDGSQRPCKDQNIDGLAQNCGILRVLAMEIPVLH